MSTPGMRIRHETRFRPTAAGTFHILLQLNAPYVTREGRERPPLDLAFVVDRSGSMAGGAFELARRGVDHALQLLDDRDSVSLVVYDDHIDTLLTQRPFGTEALNKAVRRLRRIVPRGSTDLAGGWLTGCDQLAPIADGTRTIRTDPTRSIVRTLLLTDGLANVGMTDGDEIARHASGLALRGISTTTFGVGNRYDEDLLAQMADAGRGHFHHIPDAEAIPRVFAGELGELLEMAMRDVTVSLRFPDGWQPSLLNDLPLERRDGWIVLPIGEMASRELRSLVWELTLPASSHGALDAIEIRVDWRHVSGDQQREMSMSHTIETSDTPGRQDREVQDELAQFIGARARAEAVRYNKLGQYDRAGEVVRMAAAAMPLTDAGKAAAMELLEDVGPALYSLASPADLKRHYAQSRNVQRSRKDYAKKP